MPKRWKKPTAKKRRLEASRQRRREAAAVGRLSHIDYPDVIVKRKALREWAVRAGLSVRPEPVA